MPFTKDDIQTIKDLLAGQKHELAQENKRAIVASEHALRQEMSGQTQTVLGAIKTLRETIEAIGDLADQIATQTQITSLSKRVETLEILQKTS